MTKVRLTIGLLLKEIRRARRSNRPHTCVASLARAVGAGLPRVAMFVAHNDLYETLGLPQRKDKSTKSFECILSKRDKLAEALETLALVESNMRSRGENIHEVVDLIKKAQHDYLHERPAGKSRRKAVERLRSSEHETV